MNASSMPMITGKSDGSMPMRKRNRMPSEKEPQWWWQLSCWNMACTLDILARWEKR
jgi:hypothetical protein